MNRSSSRRVLLVRRAVPVLVFALCASSACSKKSDDAVARLSSYKGDVEKDVGKGWQAVAGHDKLKCDSGLRTGEASTATITFAAGGVFQLQESTDIALSCGGNPGMSVSVGEVLVEAGPDGNVLDLEIGTVMLGGSGRYRVGQGRFDVLVGAATVRQAGDESEVLEPGDGLSWEIGAVEVKRVATEPKVVDAGVPDAGVPDAAPADAGPAAALMQATVKGKRVEQQLPGEKKWQRLKAGEHELEAGARVRLRKGSAIQLARGAQVAEATGAAEFVVGAPGQPMINSVSGQMDIHATEEPVSIEVPGGVITAQQRRGDGSKARVDVKRGTAWVRAQRGLIDVAGKNGIEDTLQIGEALVLKRDGTTTVEGRAPATTDFALASAENATIHAPRLPVTVAIPFPEACSSEGVVETSPRANFRSRVTIAKGTGRANILIRNGALYYRVRCIHDGVLQKDASAHGRLRVIRDNATQPLPKQASSSPVDADGRRYRVLYQNRLPAIVFQWPKAPKSGSYRFHLMPEEGKPESQTVDTASFKMRTGALAEGQYKFYFEAGDKRSKTSTLSIEFDNAAPSTYLRLPKVGERWTGDSIKVQGVALNGSTVAVGSTPVSVDKNGRFSSDVPLNEGEESLAVRVVHRKQGVHYYIRRAR